MKMTFLASAAALFVLSTSSFASIPAQELQTGIKAVSTAGDMEARRRPRVPGGSGCDSPRDIAEHPECRRKAEAGEFLPSSVKPTVDAQEARRRPRVPGGSGCDSPHDIAEHPECRG